MSPLSICGWLEATWISILVRESLYGFPIVVTIHLMGLTASVGTLMWFDLRLIGVFMPRYSVSRLYRRLMPWMLSGFAVMLMSGVLLFAAYATSAYGNVYFRLKLLAILTAGINAFVYHRTSSRRLAEWDEAERTPRAARIAGSVSIAAWTAVIMAGRMMSYTMF